MSETVEIVEMLGLTALSAILLTISLYVCSYHHSQSSVIMKKYVVRSSSLRFKGVLWQKLILMLGFLFLGLSQVVIFAPKSLWILAQHISVNFASPFIIVFNIIGGKITGEVMPGYGKGYIGQSLVMFGCTLSASFRYPIRTNWTKDGQNYDNLYLYVTLVAILGIFAIILLRVNTRNTLVQRKMFWWCFPLVISLIIGILLEAVNGTMASFLYRWMLPITSSMYVWWLGLLLAVEIGIILLLAFAMYILTRDWNLLYCVPVICLSLEATNTITQLLLRDPSFPIPISVVGTTIAGILITCGGVSLLSIHPKQHYGRSQFMPLPQEDTD